MSSVCLSPQTPPSVLKLECWNFAFRLLKLMPMLPWRFLKFCMVPDLLGMARQGAETFTVVCKMTAGCPLAREGFCIFSTHKKCHIYLLNFLVDMIFIFVDYSSQKVHLYNLKTQFFNIKMLSKLSLLAWPNLKDSNLVGKMMTQFCFTFTKRLRIY